MVRAKRQMDIDVLTAARARMEHIYSIFDSVVILCSGGKDSTATTLLAKEVCEEYDLGPVNVIFRDEEVINFSVLDWVEKLMNEPWVNLRWYALTTRGAKFILGQKLSYTAWDPEREWIHPMPEWAITNESVGYPNKQVLPLNVQDEIAATEFKGSVAFVTGIRASESLQRFRSVTQKLNENYINKIEGSPRSRIRTCRPIYDWQENDVLKYLHETGFGWTPLYDWQELARQGLRVSTPLHTIAARKFDKLRLVEPEFYERVIDVFPEMLVQERYWKEFDVKGLMKEYKEADPDSFAGIFRYIEDSFPEERKKLAYARVRDWKMRRKKDPENYPVNLLLKELMFNFRGPHNRLAGKYVDSKYERKRREASD